MRLRDALRVRRQAKAHRRHEEDRERQKALQGQDAQGEIKDVARKAGPISFPYSS